MQRAYLLGGGGWGVANVCVGLSLAPHKIAIAENRCVSNRKLQVSCIGPAISAAKSPEDRRTNRRKIAAFFEGRCTKKSGVSAFQNRGVSGTLSGLGAVFGDRSCRGMGGGGANFGCVWRSLKFTNIYS